MGINCHEFLEYVIQPTLKQLGVESQAAEKLLLATACYQSDMGHHLQQSDGIGIFGISEGTHKDVWDSHIALDCDLASNVRGMASQHGFPKAPHCELATNLRYATAIAWMVYQYRGLQLTDDSDIAELTNGWQNCFMDRPISFKERDEFARCCHKFHPGSRSIAA
jgi:hypothetical protein